VLRVEPITVKLQGMWLLKATNEFDVLDCKVISLAESALWNTNAQYAFYWNYYAPACHQSRMHWILLNVKLVSISLSVCLSIPCTY